MKNRHLSKAVRQQCFRAEFQTMLLLWKPDRPGLSGRNLRLWSVPELVSSICFFAVQKHTQRSRNETEKLTAFYKFSVTERGGL